MKKVSLKDIAREVGVSTALVSYVLNNLKQGRISKEIAAQIKEVAVRMNYRPNQIARSLKTRKTMTIGLIVADISNPFSSTLARIVEDEAIRHDYTVIFGSSDENADKFDRVLDTLLNRQVDGLILSPPAHSQHRILELQRQELPFVLLDRYYPDLETNHVILDNHAATFEATRHLAEEGARRIAYIGYSTPLQHLQERRAGYEAAMKVSGLPQKKAWNRQVDIIDNKQQIARAMKDVLSLTEPVDALLFGSNVIAVQGLRYLSRTAIRVPEELALVGFDESEVFDLFHPPLSFVRQPLQEMGKKATEILLENISRPSGVTRISMKASMVWRQSSLRQNQAT